MKQTFIYLGGYIIIGLIVAVVVSAIEMSVNKEHLQGPLAGIVWPLSIIALGSFAVAIAFAELSEFLAIKLLKLLKVE